MNPETRYMSGGGDGLSRRRGAKRQREGKDMLDGVSNKAVSRVRLQRFGKYAHLPIFQKMRRSMFTFSIVHRALSRGGGTTES